MTERDETDEQQRKQFWELAGLTERQIPEFGLLVVTYLDVDGERRFNWRIADGTDGMELDAMIEVLRNLAQSLAESAVDRTDDFPDFDPNGLMDPGNPGDSTDL